VCTINVVFLRDSVHIHTILYSANRENESEELAHGDWTVKAYWSRWDFNWPLKVDNLSRVWICAGSEFQADFQVSKTAVCVCEGNTGSLATCVNCLRARSPWCGIYVRCTTSIGSRLEHATPRTTYKLSSATVPRSSFSTPTSIEYCSSVFIIIRLCRTYSISGLLFLSTSKQGW